MANPPDPDFSSFDSLPDGGVSVAQTAEDAATGVAVAVTRFGEKNRGSAVNDAAAAASEVTNAGRAMAVNAAIAQQAAKDLKAARDAWNKAAEGAKQKDLDAADKAVADARADLAKAQAAEDAQREKYDAAKSDTSAEGKLNAVALKSALDMAAAETTKAQTKVDAAVMAAQKLHAQNRSACEALRATMQRVADSLKNVNATTCPPGMTPHTGTGDGYGAGSGSGNGSGTPAGKGTGSGATTPGGKSPAATPGKTPGSTPAAATPETKTSSGSSDADLIKAAAALSQGQQGQQQPQTQQAQQQMPTMPQVPQQATQQQPKAGEKSDLEKQAEKNSQEIDRLLGVGGTSAALGLGGGSTSPVTTPSQAPAGPATQLRPAGTPITGAGLSGAPAVNQQLPTTGTSRTDLVTTQNNTEVGGRPVGAENKAFSPAPDGSAQTRTSSATDTGTGQGTGGRTAGAPAAGAPGLGGMPVGGVGAPASPSGRGGDKDGKTVTAATDQLGVFDEMSRAVPGGTIAQNRPSRGEAA